ncbi:hypothetical protein [Flammeovirga agarivorans]|uniref:Uncharacterized protein n=1 Tax=Flammeovirga agarivorans TaxID=2726742 RepID=A0A7X8SR85_9BACT|nr:hypothetical protein [Flammeovirga agarivorans]NLR94932.1 hypothetical protein [Flammeovirga agarivorans]
MDTGRMETEFGESGETLQTELFQRPSSVKGYTYDQLTKLFAGLVLLVAIIAAGLVYYYPSLYKPTMVVLAIGILVGVLLQRNAVISNSRVTATSAKVFSAFQRELKKAPLGEIARNLRKVEKNTRHR